MVNFALRVFLSQFKKMIQCLFHCTWGKIRIPCLGLQEPSKLVLSTSFLTCSLSFFLSYLPLLPSRQTWSPSQTLAILPASHACVTLLCLSSCTSPAQSPRLHLLCLEKSHRSQDSTQAQPPSKAVSEPLASAWANCPLSTLLHAAQA